MDFELKTNMKKLRRELEYLKKYYLIGPFLKRLSAIYVGRRDSKKRVKFKRTILFRNPHNREPNIMRFNDYEFESISGSRYHLLILKDFSMQEVKSQERDYAMSLLEKKGL